MTHSTEKPLQLLVVENRRGLRRHIVSQLMPNYTVHTAETAEEAVHTLLSYHYDLAIIREHLPLMNGFSLLHYIRNTIGNPLPALMILDREDPQLLRATEQIKSCNYLLSREIAYTSILRRYLSQLLSQHDYETKISELHHRLKEVSHIDPLTRAYNRTYLDQNLLLTLARARVNGDALTMVMIDVDDFKMVNDRYGHLMGDKVLTEISSSIRHHLRDSDILCRYGGDEFLVLFPKTSREDALDICSRIQNEIETQCRTHLNIPVTISVGLIPLSAELENCEALLHEADRHLYLAKENGKNCIYFN